MKSNNAERPKMTNQKPPIDFTPLADAAAQIAFFALVGFIVWVCLR